jgi:hypothetical protein
VLKEKAKFFDERTDESEVKARIVEKYFHAWANIVLGTAQRFKDGRIGYIDLYAGPGRYSARPLVPGRTPSAISKGMFNSRTCRRVSNAGFVRCLVMPLPAKTSSISLPERPLHGNRNAQKRISAQQVLIDRGYVRKNHSKLIRQVLLPGARKSGLHSTLVEQRTAGGALRCPMRRLRDPQ